MSRDSVTNSPRPRSLILIGINVVVWIALALWASLHATVVGYFLIAMLLVPVLLLTTTMQVVMHFVLRNRDVRPALRTVMFFLPTLVIIGMGLLTPTRPRPANQQQGTLSPSGKYVLFVPNAGKSEDPQYSNFEVWKVTIKDAQGKLLYKDDESTFLNHLSVYWVWDAEDRVWLYNSDDGGVHFWENVDGVWIKTAWGHARPHSGALRHTGREIAPPDSLYPDYIKKEVPEDLETQSL